MKNGIYKPRDAYCDDDDGIACLRMYNIDAGQIVWKDIKRMRLSEDEKREYGLLPGDLLVNRVNSRELVGKAAPVRRGLEACVFESKNIRVRLKRELADPQFVGFALQANGQSYFNRNAQQVVGMASISQPQVAAFPLPLPPLEKQQVIVAEIEKQFTRLEAGVAALRRVQANLKRYRASALKAACEGKLVPTEAELQRSAGKGQNGYESGEQLLKRILVERREHWTGHGQYKEPAAPNTANLPPLPAGWTWATLDSLIREPLRNGHSAKATGTQTGLRVFTLSAVTEGDFSVRNTKLSVATPEKVAGLWAEPGDIYVERSNTPELVGIARLYKGAPRFAFIPDLFIRVRVASPISERYIEMCLLSERGRTFFRSRAQGISGTMPKIDQKTVELAPIPLPPFSEQTRIVAEVERRLSVVQELESAVSANLQRAIRLRQSVLQQAFNGNLIKDAA